MVVPLGFLTHSAHRMTKLGLVEARLSQQKLEDNPTFRGAHHQVCAGFGFSRTWHNTDPQDIMAEAPKL